MLRLDLNIDGWRDTDLTATNPEGYARLHIINTTRREWGNNPDGPPPKITTPLKNCTLVFCPSLIS